ncbi:MAG: hypothetical protein IPI91_20330 [Flavobacteriales bacterium]|nr:hypothetical protein [Flavobacteriales bacterium]
MAIADDAIEKAALKFPQSEAAIVHCSGARSLDALEPHADRGVLWPIQTLGTGEPIDLSTAITGRLIATLDHARFSLVRA